MLNQGVLRDMNHAGHRRHLPFGQLIANTAYRYNQTRARWNLLDLLTETAHTDVNEVRLADILIAPDLTEECLPIEDLTSVCGKEVE
jgi:hypothetical protein